MGRKVIIFLLSAAVAGTVLVLAPASLARPADPIEPTETTAPAEEAEEAEARADLPETLAGLPLCTRTVSHKYGNRPAVSVPAASNGTKSCLIGDGLVGCDRCAPIRALQNALKTCHGIKRANGEPFRVDGSWGPQTKAALKRAQSDVGITADGIYGPNTRNRMKFVYVIVTTRGPVTDCIRY